MAYALIEDFNYCRNIVQKIFLAFNRQRVTIGGDASIWKPSSLPLNNQCEHDSVQDPCIYLGNDDLKPMALCIVS